MPKRDEVDAAGLDARAARLMGKPYNPFWPDRVRFSPSTDLNDAAELFRAAPEAVRFDAARNLFASSPGSFKADTVAYILDPAALTRAIVEAWEVHKAKGGEDA